MVQKQKDKRIRGLHSNAHSGLEWKILTLAAYKGLSPIEDYPNHPLVCEKLRIMFYWRFTKQRSIY